jgi:hypothetical protein
LKHAYFYDDVVVGSMSVNNWKTEINEVIVFSLSDFFIFFVLAAPRVISERLIKLNQVFDLGSIEKKNLNAAAF